MFLFLDIETTGLDPQWDSILEFGIKGYADNLEFASHHQYDTMVKPRSTWLDRINAEPFVQAMHAESGLTEAIGKVKGQLPNTLEVQATVLQLLEDWDLKPNTQPICGSSVQFDREFLAEYMPKLEAWFHYRNIDVSTIKEIAQRWYPSLPEPDLKPQGKHRVVSDINDSVNLLKYYRGKIFKTPLV